MDQFEQAPMGGGMGADVRDKVQVPAIILMVIGGFYILMNLCGLGGNILGMTGVLDQTQQMAADPQMQQFANMSSGVGGIIGSFLGMALGGLMVYGGLQMKNLENYPLAMAGAIAGMIPCTLCCLLGLPAGIFALVTLLDDRVKASFTS